MMDKLENNPYGRTIDNPESDGFGRFNPGNGRPDIDNPSLPRIKNRPTNEKVDEKLIADISESVMRALNEMNYNGIDDIIETAYNDYDCGQKYWEIVRMLRKKVEHGTELDLGVLYKSSMMDKYCRFCYRKLGIGRRDINPNSSPQMFKRTMAKRMIDDVYNY